MKQLTILILIVFQTLVFAQKKENPILFYEIYVARAVGDTKGWLSGGELNYQFKDNLITTRISAVINNKYTGSFLGIIPVYIPIETIDEYALLYGKRHEYDDYSFSYSGGISLIDREFDTQNGNSNTQIFADETYFGFPFEVNLKFFKSERQRIKLYYLIPVGKPTSFGGSFGLKILGNISKRSFVGFGFSYSFGWHKKY